MKITFLILFSLAILSGTGGYLDNPMFFNLRYLLVAFFGIFYFDYRSITKLNLIWGVFALFYIGFSASSIDELEKPSAFFLTIFIFSVALVNIDRRYNIFQFILRSIPFISILFILSFWIGINTQVLNNDNARIAGDIIALATFSINGGLLVLFNLLALRLEKSNNFYFFLKILIIIGIIITLAITGQRAGLVISGVGILVLVLSQNFKKIVLLTSSFILLFILLVSLFPSRFHYLHGRFQNYETGRSEIWSKTISLIKENPVLGNGPGSSYQITNMGVHNAFLKIFVEIGLIPFLLLAFAVLFSIYISFESLIREGKQNVSIQYSFCVFVSTLIIYMVESGLSPTNFSTISLVFAMAFFNLSKNQNNNFETIKFE